MTFSRIAVIYNPGAGRKRKKKCTEVQRFADFLRAGGYPVDVLATERPNHATDLAREAIQAGCDLVVAHGGDGTMNEVLQAVVGTEATLAFWPGGTANVLAAEIHFPTKPYAAARRVLDGTVERVTVGKANDRYFLLMAGIGLDAAVAEGVNPLLKERLGKGAFGISALQFGLRGRLPPFQVELEGEQVEGRFLVAGNAHSYGGGFRFTPRAQLDDPSLHLCIIDGKLRTWYLLVGFAALWGLHLNLPGVTYREVAKAKVTGAPGEYIPIQVDGEVTGRVPVTLKAIPRGVRLLV